MKMNPFIYSYPIRRRSSRSRSILATLSSAWVIVSSQATNNSERASTCNAHCQSSAVKAKWANTCVACRSITTAIRFSSEAANLISSALFSSKVLRRGLRASYSTEIVLERPVG